MHSNMIEYLNIFVQVVEQGSFTRAADILQIHRPTVSKVLWSSFFGHADQMVGLCTGGQLGGRAGQRFVLCG